MSRLCHCFITDRQPGEERWTELPDGDIRIETWKEDLVRCGLACGLAMLFTDGVTINGKDLFVVRVIGPSLPEQHDIQIT